MKSDIPERTFEFARRVVKLCQVLDEKPGVSRTLANQLLRSGTSIGANVEEGQPRKVKSTLSANTASPVKRPGKRITGFAYWHHPSSCCLND